MKPVFLNIKVLRFEHFDRYVRLLIKRVGRYINIDVMLRRIERAAGRADRFIVRINYVYRRGASAAAFAGWLKLSPAERKGALVILTGNGLKESKKLGELFPPP